MEAFNDFLTYCVKFQKEKILKKKGNEKILWNNVRKCPITWEHVPVGEKRSLSSQQNKYEKPIQRTLMKSHNAINNESILKASEKKYRFHSKKKETEQHWISQ